MISVNGDPIDFTCFPDGTTSFRYDPSLEEEEFIIQWKYDGDHECILLWYLVHRIRSYDSRAEIILQLPYIPNARMDRVKSSDEVFTLKYFAEFINSLSFDFVVVRDPHSNVAPALLNNVEVLDARCYIMQAIANCMTCGENLLLCYPDEGAAKRYTELLKREHVFCIKHRDWRTGNIERLELTNPELVEGRNVLIVDDICSRGGTFTHTARALREAGAKDIFLYITHCENTIKKGTILTDGLIKHVYTTGSIYRGNHEMITVLF